MTTYKVGYLVGNLSSTSINRVPSKGLHPGGARPPGVQRDSDRPPAVILILSSALQ